MNQCRVNQCRRKVHARKLCNMHVKRWYRNGEAGSVEHRKVPNGTHSKMVGGERVYHDKKYLKERSMRWREINGGTIGLMHRARFGGNRDKVLKRDDHACQICGMTDEEHRNKWGVEITIDHMDGRGRNSTNKNHEMENLWTLCRSCHGRRDIYRYYLGKGKHYSNDIITTHRL